MALKKKIDLPSGVSAEYYNITKMEIRLGAEEDPEEKTTRRITKKDDGEWDVVEEVVPSKKKYTVYIEMNGYRDKIARENELSPLTSRSFRFVVDMDTLSKEGIFPTCYKLLKKEGALAEAQDI